MTHERRLRAQLSVYTGHRIAGLAVLQDWYHAQHIRGLPTICECCKRSVEAQGHADDCELMSEYFEVFGMTANPEDAQKPVDVKAVHPGAVLKEYLDDMGVSISDFAQHINISRKQLSRIVNEHASITVDTALRFEHAFRESPIASRKAAFWLNLQRDFDMQQHLAQKAGEYERIERLNVL